MVVAIRRIQRIQTLLVLEYLDCKWQSLLIH